MCLVQYNLNDFSLQDENNPMQGGAMGGVRGYENGGGEPERAPRGGPPMERPPYREDPYYVSYSLVTICQFL